MRVVFLRIRSFIFVLFISLVAFIAGIVFYRKVILRPVITDNILENMLNKGSVKFGFFDMFNGFNGVEIIVDDNLSIKEICTYRNSREDGVCVLLDLDNQFSVVNLDEYRNGNLDGITLVYLDGELSAIRYVLNDYFVGNSIIHLNDFNPQKGVNKYNSFTYEFLGEPKYINDKEVIKSSYCYVFYNHIFPESIDIDGGCKWYRIKGNNVFCIGYKPRFSIAMIPTEFFEYENDTLVVYLNKGYDDFIKEKLSLYFFFFCPPTSICKACLWQWKKNDTICFNTYEERNFMNTDFYKPKKIEDRYLSFKSKNKTIKLMSRVYIRDTLFNIELAKFDTTIILFKEKSKLNE